MKKLIVGLLTVISFLAMSTCGVDQKNTAQTSSSTKESAEVSSGTSRQVYTDPKEMKESYDIVIMGAGGTGMTVAIEAKDAGLNPVTFEKMPAAGGNTSKSSSGMNASETKFQKEEGIEDSNEALYEETLKGGGGTNDKEILRYFVNHSTDAIDWLDQNGIKLDSLTIIGGMGEKRMYRPSDGSATDGCLVDGLSNSVHERKIPIFINTDVTDIRKNGETVNEVTVHVQGEEPKEITDKTIVVTTGGLGANKEFIERYRPDLADYITTNQEGSTEDGTTMIEKLDGQTVDMDEIQIHPTMQQDEGTLIGEVVRGEGAILVNQKGKRFMNEMDTRDKVSAAITALPEKSAYLIFDQGVRDRATATELYDQKGYVTTGKTVEELAEKVDSPKETLAKTIDGWNADIAEKKDAQFNRAAAMEHDLSPPNCYAIKITPGIHYTMGGVKINTNTEALDEENQPISGLYAAGEVIGGLHGDNRVGGNSVAEIIIFGRQAGIQAARLVPENE